MKAASPQLFSIAALLLRWQPRFRRYWQIAYAFFTAASVIFVTSLTANMRDALFRSIGLAAGTNQEIAAGKMFEAMLTVTTILLLSRLAGFSLELLYIKRGNLKWGLILGLGVLVNFASSALMFFADRFTTVDQLGGAILWGMVFSIVNGFMEELWLRSQFLRKLEPLLGTWCGSCTDFALVCAVPRWRAVYDPAGYPLFPGERVHLWPGLGICDAKNGQHHCPGLDARCIRFLFVHRHAWQRVTNEFSGEMRSPTLILVLSCTQIHPPGVLLPSLERCTLIATLGRFQEDVCQREYLFPTQDQSQRRHEVSQTAVSLFIEKGFRETTMQEVARTAGMGKSTLYDYFQSKDEILIFYVWMRSNA